MLRKTNAPRPTKCFNCDVIPTRMMGPLAHKLSGGDDLEGVISTVVIDVVPEAALPTLGIPIESQTAPCPHIEHFL